MKIVKKFPPNKISLLGLLIILIPFLWACAPSGVPGNSQLYADEKYVSDFPELDGYGQWFTVPPYGEVWQPSVIDNWQPFSYGKWVWTDQGWAWVSYEPYGWLVFHYGNWDYQPSLGWFWIPGYQWSPARVRWIEYGDYICWAPFPPTGVVWPEPWVSTRINIWIVVDRDKFLYDDIGRNRISGFPRREPQRTIIRDREPDVLIIERAVKHPIPVIRVQQEPVRYKEREFQRMRLPEEQRPSIEKKRDETRQEILRPPPRPVPRERNQEKVEPKTKPDKNKTERPIQRQEPKKKESDKK